MKVQNPPAPFNAAAPGAIGGTTPAAATFTTATINTQLAVAANGTAAAPSVYVGTGGNAKGLWASGNELGFATNGTSRWFIGNTAGSFYSDSNGVIQNSNGAINNCAYGFISDGADGLYRNASHDIRWANTSADVFGTLAGKSVCYVPLVLKSYTVATLPSASTIGAGGTAFVTDASTTLILGLGLAVVGGGANKVPVYSDGTSWLYG